MLLLSGSSLTGRLLAIRGRRHLSTSSKTIIGKILHGTAPSDQEKRVQDEHTHDTHSKLLARGKYVHEMQSKPAISEYVPTEFDLDHTIVHQIKPEATEDYAGLISERYSQIAADPENKVNLVGSWQTIIGDLDQAVHIWEYRGYPGYHNTMARLQSSEEHRQFERKLAPMLRGRKNEICLEFAFWLTSPPNEHGKVYELRTYELKVRHMMAVCINTNMLRSLDAYLTG
jgi:hypothetical protein